MVYYVLLLLSLFLCVAKNILSKYGEKSFGFLNGIMSVSIITAILAMIIFASGISYIKEAAEILFILMSLAYGALTLGMQSFYIVAVKDGSVSICSQIYASSFILPMIYSVIRNKEKVTGTKVLGVILIIISIMLVSFKQKAGRKIPNKSLKFAILAMISSGGVGILQKEFGNIYSSKLLNTFLFLSFFFMLIIALLFKIFLLKKSDNQIIYNKNFLIPGISLALSTVFVNKLNLILAANILGIIFFPLLNGGVIMLSAVNSAIFFKEKITNCMWFGMILGVFAVIVISL